MSYSPFFQPLHDEKQAVGHFGRGTHYSVLRVPIWHDERLKPLPQGELLDFAIIWDEDHDDRVIEPIEEMYFAGFARAGAVRRRAQRDTLGVDRQ